MDEVVAKITDSFRSKVGENLIVGISGIDGSGKSTLASQVEDSLVGCGIPTGQINLDDFLHPKPIRHKNPDQVQGYFNENFDYLNLVTHVLDPARKNARIDCQLPVLDLESDQITDHRFQFNGPGVLIVEGVFLFRKELREKFDLKVWIEMSFECAMTRILERTRDQRYGDINAIRSRYETRFFPTQRFHLDRDKPADAADLILSSRACRS